MKIAALDIGTKKIGVAWGNLEDKIILPGKIIEFKSEEKFLEDIQDLIDEKGISKIIVGVPESDRSNVEESFQYKTGKKLESIIPVEFIDESLSTVEAREMLEDYGINEWNEDVEAAMVILERWFETN